MKKALILGAEGFEDLELLVPKYRMAELGWTVDLAGPSHDAIAGKHGYTVIPNLTFREIKPIEYDLLIIPGGKAPETVRLDEHAIKTVKYFFDTGKPVAAICHGPQVLISAGVVKGRKLTGWKGIRDDIIAAGGLYEDREVLVDGNLVTSRMPDDLPQFLRETVLMLENVSARA